MKRQFPMTDARPAALVGCLHLLPLPGAAGWDGSLEPIVDLCLRDAEAWMDNGADGLLIENTHDTPYHRAIAEPGTVAAMAIAARECRRRWDVPIGIQILAAADMAALEVAIAADLDFVRCEGFAFAHVADEGLIQGEAARLVRRRAHLRAEHIELWSDVKKKHSSHAITGDLTPRDWAKGAAYCAADGFIITGSMTGEAPQLDDLASVSGLGPRVVVGSGTSFDNARALGEKADVLVVGTACKEDGDWRRPVEPARVQRLVAALNGI